jgi:hypothetical protein
VNSANLFFDLVSITVTVSGILWVLYSVFLLVVNFINFEFYKNKGSIRHSLSRIDGSRFASKYR